APYDRDGERARRGRPAVKVLEALLADAFFSRPPPKSTGREMFGMAYADRLVEQVRAAGGSDNDAVATACALTVESIARALERWTPVAPDADLVISGGGARNPALVEMLAARVRPRPVVGFDQRFFDGDAKEAVAFAFLGWLTVNARPGNLPAATGARGPRTPRRARRPRRHPRGRHHHGAGSPVRGNQLGVRARVRPRSRAEEPDRGDPLVWRRSSNRGRARRRLGARVPGARRPRLRQALPRARPHHAGLA